MSWREGFELANGLGRETQVSTCVNWGFLTLGCVECIDIPMWREWPCLETTNTERKSCNEINVMSRFVFSADINVHCNVPI